jgi:hypothetical protein
MAKIANDQNREWPKSRIFKPFIGHSKVNWFFYSFRFFCSATEVVMSLGDAIDLIPTQKRSKTATTKKGVPSKKGFTAHVDGQIFRADSSANTVYGIRHYWVCSIKGCKSRMTTDSDDKIVGVGREHTDHEKPHSDVSSLDG